MANYISQVNVSGTTYFLKDKEARAAVSNLETAVSSSLIFKGVIASAAELTELTDYKQGWTYKASAAFTISDLGVVENGDMIICISNYSGGYKATDWTIVQNNVDIMTGATLTSDGTKGLVPIPIAGSEDKFLSGDGTWKTAISWGSFSELIPPPALAEIWGDETTDGDETWWKNLQISTLAATPEERAACVGKTKKVTLISPVLGTQIHSVRCIGADQDGDKTLTFQTTGTLNQDTQFGSSAVWIGSTARSKCQEYYNAFPGKSYVKTVRKGTCPSTNNSRNGSVTYNDETVFLLSEREFGLGNYAPISTANSTTTKAECTQGYNAPYSYYNSDSRRIFYKDDGSGSVSSNYGFPWERSRYYYLDYSDYACYVNSNGTEYYRRCSSSRGLAPAFVIG